MAENRKEEVRLAEIDKPEVKIKLGKKPEKMKLKHLK